MSFLSCVWHVDIGEGDPGSEIKQCEFARLSGPDRPLTYVNINKGVM